MRKSQHNIFKSKLKSLKIFLERAEACQMARMSGSERERELRNGGILKTSLMQRIDKIYLSLNPVWPAKG